jgi:hypothetical protein
VGDPGTMRACGVLSRASTARGRSVPAGPRSPPTPSLRFSF